MQKEKHTCEELIHCVICILLQCQGNCLRVLAVTTAVASVNQTNVSLTILQKVHHTEEKILTLLYFVQLGQW